MRNEWPGNSGDIRHELFDKLFNLGGEVAIVTGGMGLLGSQYVMTLMKAGANVVALDLKDHFADDVAKLAREMSGLGHWMAGQAWTCDITNKKEIQGFFKWMEEAERGTPTILINNAGLDSRPDAPASDNGLFENYSEETWHAVLDSHLTGMFLMSQEFIRNFRAARESGKIGKDKWAKIVNISSTYGLVSPDQAIYDFRRSDGDIDYNKPVGYSVAKSGVLNFTRWLAGYCGYHRLNIRVNTLAPGGVKENQDSRFIAEYVKRTPLKRMANPDDYNGAILFLVSEASRYMTGSTLVVDGGWTAL